MKIVVDASKHSMCMVKAGRQCRKTYMNAKLAEAYLLSKLTGEPVEVEFGMESVKID